MQNKQIKILRFLRYKTRTLEEIAIKLKYKSADVFCNSSDYSLMGGDFTKYIDLNSVSGDYGKWTASISPIGLEFLETLDKENHRWRVPIIISIIALVKSCDAEIIAFVRWVSTLLFP